MNDINRVSVFSRYFVAGICFIATLGGFLFGYDLVVVGGAKPFYEAHFSIGDRPFLQGWVVSCAYAGCLLGAVLAGTLTERFGRKRPLLLAGILFAVSSIGMGLAPGVNELILFRIICGIGIGMASTLSPMYIAEIAPTTYRGRFVAFNQLAIVVGILTAQIVNLMIAQRIPSGFTAADIAGSWNGLYAWRWMFGVVSIPSFLFFILMLFVPESPRWLAKKGKRSEAANVLEKIGGSKYADDEMTEIVKSLEDEERNTSRLTDLFSPRLLPIVALGIFIAVYSQWSGLTVIFNYAEEIFQAAGFPMSGMMLNIVITGLVNLLFTFVAIATVDRWGRKPLFCLGSGGLALIFTILGTCYFFQITGLFMLFLVVSAIGCFAMTIGPVTWVLLSELFPNRVRGTAMSLAVFSLWIGCTTLTLTFPLLNHSLGASGAFWIYAAISAAAFLIMLRFLPETKGKSLEQIEIELMGHNSTKK